MNSIRFSYDANVSLFNNLNLIIPHGQRLLIIGESGSGKTTLIQLILGLLAPQEGTIQIGNQKISSNEQVVNLIAYIPQYATLFHRSISENILYGNEHLNRNDILQACEFSLASNFIYEFENNFDTIVGDSGANLSGGQCQRIAIARALARKTPVLILDEATSSLDMMMERTILQNIIKASPSISLIMVLHRYQNYDLFDRVLHLERGIIKSDIKVVELSDHWWKQVNNEFNKLSFIT